MHKLVSCCKTKVFFGPKMPQKFTGSINFAPEVSFLPQKFSLRSNFAPEVFTKEKFYSGSLQNVAIFLAILPFCPQILNLTIKSVKDHTCRALKRSNLESKKEILEMLSSRRPEFVKPNWSKGLKGLSQNPKEASLMI